MAVEIVQREYENGSLPWFVGFSGGKDSSALIKVVYEALRRSSRRDRLVTVVYCDTGVEIPVVARQVHGVLAGLANEATRDALPIGIRIAEPSLRDRFFVKVIGRGYPPPTNKFRWCTDRLRIRPVRDVIRAGQGRRAIVLLGTRWGESSARDLVMRRRRRQRYFFSQASNPNVTVFSPIADFGIKDVWSTIFALPRPSSIDPEHLATLYRDAGAECPLVRDARGTPCGAGRFGCWTCTVVRKDKAVAAMVGHGYDQLAPLHAFRNWLQEVRADKGRRCRFRRNGQRGLGPFTLAARKEILRRLRQTQREAPWRLITDDEICEIHRLWRADRRSSAYKE